MTRSSSAWLLVVAVLALGLNLPEQADGAEARDGYGVVYSHGGVRVAPVAGPGVVVEVLSDAGPEQLSVRVDLDGDGELEFAAGPGEFSIEGCTLRGVGLVRPEEGSPMPTWERVELRPTARSPEPNAHFSAPVVRLHWLDDGNHLIEVDDDRDGQLEARVITRFGWATGGSDEFLLVGSAPGNALSPISWPEAVDEKYGESHFTEVITGYVEGCALRGSTVLSIDCSEPPCIAAIRTPPTKWKVGARNRWIQECPAWAASYGPTATQATGLVSCTGERRIRYELVSPYMEEWIEGLDQGARDTMKARRGERWQQLLDDVVCGTNVQ